MLFICYNFGIYFERYTYLCFLVNVNHHPVCKRSASQSEGILWPWKVAFHCHLHLLTDLIMEAEVLSNPEWSVPLRKFPRGVFAFDSSGNGVQLNLHHGSQNCSDLWSWSLSVAVAKKTTGCNFLRFSISNEVSFRDSLSNLFIIYILLFLHPVKQNKCLTKKKFFRFWVPIQKSRNWQGWDYSCVPVFPSLYLDFAVVLKYGYLVSWESCKLYTCCVLLPVSYYSYFFQRNFPYTGDTSGCDTCASQYSSYENL